VEGLVVGGCASSFGEARDDWYEASIEAEEDGG
jgi:hypothetical protein